jgi:hypothetical protein
MGRRSLPQVTSIRVKTILAILVLLGLTAYTYANINAPISEITLTNGKTYKNFEIRGFTENVFSAKWDGGRGTFPYRLLPDDLRAEAENKGPEIQDPIPLNHPIHSWPWQSSARLKNGEWKQPIGESKPTRPPFNKIGSQRCSNQNTKKPESNTETPK